MKGILIFIFMAFLGLILLGKCSSGPEIEKGSFSDKQICTATIAIVMGKSVKDMFAVHLDGNVNVMYQRESDQKTFSYECYVIKNEVKWKFASYDWNHNSAKEQYTFEVIKGEEGGEQLSVLANYGDSESHLKQNFSQHDF